MSQAEEPLGSGGCYALLISEERVLRGNYFTSAYKEIIMVCINRWHF